MPKGSMYTCSIYGSRSGCAMMWSILLGPELHVVGRSVVPKKFSAMSTRLHSRMNLCRDEAEVGSFASHAKMTGELFAWCCLMSFVRSDSICCLGWGSSMLLFRSNRHCCCMAVSGPAPVRLSWHTRYAEMRVILELACPCKVVPAQRPMESVILDAIRPVHPPVRMRDAPPGLKWDS